VNEMMRSVKASGSSYVTRSRIRQNAGFRYSPAFWRMRLRECFFLPLALATLQRSVM
jgi:hypothetical protein